MKLLVTGGGAPGIRGTLHCLKHNPDSEEVRVHVSDIQSRAIGRVWADGFLHSLPPEHNEYLDHMREYCVSNEITAIIPQTTREIEVLSMSHNFFKKAGCTVVVSEKKAIELANNKVRTAALFKQLRLPYPEFYITHNREEMERAAYQLGYPENPVIVKPPTSNGSRGFRKIADEKWNVEKFLNEKPSGDATRLEELIEILSNGQWPTLMVSEYLPGKEYSVDCFRGANLAISIPRSRDVIRSGISFQTRIDLRSDLVDYSNQAAEAIGLRYAFGFQYKQSSTGELKVLESNPRIQGTMVASLMSGVNVIWLGLKEALGQSPHETPELRDGGVFTRYWGGVGICEGESFEI
jgi:carbamoyl-phosphate synthase large subunit